MYNVACRHKATCVALRMGKSSDPEAWLTKAAPGGDGEWLVRVGDSEAFHCTGASTKKSPECATRGGTGVATGVRDLVCMDLTANEWLATPSLDHGGDRDPTQHELRDCAETDSCDMSCTPLKCAAGQYGSNHKCVPCPAGTFNDNAGHNDAACKPCPEGEYTTATGATACVACASCAADTVRLECGAAQPGWCLHQACGAAGTTCWVGPDQHAWSGSPRSWSKGALPTATVGARVGGADGGPVIASQATAAWLEIESVVELAEDGELLIHDDGDDDGDGEGAASTTPPPTPTPAPAPSVAPGTVGLDFSPFNGQQLVDFDLGCKTVRPGGGCTEGRDMEQAYSAQGIAFKDTANLFAGEDARSPGFGAANGPPGKWGNAPMSFTYARGASNVGFYYSGPDKDMSITVTDCAGKDFHFTITNNGRGRPTNARFFGVRAACLKTFVISGGGYMIDDLRWNP